MRQAVVDGQIKLETERKKLVAARAEVTVEAWMNGKKPASLPSAGSELAVP